MNYRRLLVGSETGSLTGFITKGNGNIYGLSAFHVLSGSDKKINPYEDSVKVLDQNTNEWIYFGKTVDGVYTRGYHTYGNYGILDYAIFEIENEFLNRISNSLIDLKLSPFLNDRFQSIIGIPVFAYSVINQAPISGRVVKLHSNNYDLQIEIDSSFYCERGDSGMLWKDENNCAIAMHLAGNKLDNANNSYGTIIARILDNKGYRLSEYS